MRNVKAVTVGMMGALLAAGLIVSRTALAADYGVDVRGMHASVMFKVAHLGYSTLAGRFNRFDGTFSWDKDNAASSAVDVTIEMDSLDTNHAERDKHLRGADYLNVEKNPTTHFKSKRYEGNADGGRLIGDLTMNGVTKEITLDVKHVGEGSDPWGGFRAGFDATVALTSADFGWTAPSFPKTIAVELHLEGVRK